MERGNLVTTTKGLLGIIVSDGGSACEVFLENGEREILEPSEIALIRAESDFSELVKAYIKLRGFE